MKNKSMIRKKNIRLIGIDNDVDYLTAAKTNLVEEALESNVRLYQYDVYKINELRKHMIIPNGIGKHHAITKTEDGPLFDAVLMSGTLALLHDKISAFKLLKGLLKPNGKIIIAQTYQRALPPLSREMKPLMKYLTSIDQGEIITEEEAQDLYKTVSNVCKLEISKHEYIRNSIDNAFEVAYVTVLAQKEVAAEKPVVAQKEAAAEKPLVAQKEAEEEENNDNDENGGEI